MAFTIHPATLSDIPSLATVSLASFADDPIVGYYARSVAPDILYEHQLKRYKRRFEGSALTGLRVWKVVEEANGEVVALSRWQIPQTLSADHKAEKDKFDNSPLPKPDGWDKVLEKEFSEALDERYEKWVDDTKDYYLCGLSVLPSHQRLGLGTLLLRQGLAMADEVGAKTYLESSAKGAPLYLRHGFKQVDDILIDMRPYGGTGVESSKCMVREAGGR